MAVFYDYLNDHLSISLGILLAREDIEAMVWFFFQIW